MWNLPPTFRPSTVAATRRILLALFATGLCRAEARADDAAAVPAVFQVGVAERDVTPTEPTPMWGYAERHAALSQGTADPLWAKAVVLTVGDDKLALVGTDLGRGPTIAMMDEIRAALAEKAGIDHVIISGSHSHHGPVLELTDRPGFGQGAFDGAVRYSQALPGMLVELILKAERTKQPAKLGVATRDVPHNRNRHTKREPRTTDPQLAVVRFDNLAGEPLAVLVNFAAHPVMTEVMDLRFSADWPGAMKGKVERELGTKCVFLQGAAGDMSPNPPPGVSGPQAFGQAVADVVLELARGCATAVPEKPQIKGQVDRYLFGSRIDFNNTWIMAAFARAFFPELVRNFQAEYREGIRAELNTVLVNRELAFVAGSGEFFSNHAVRLRQRCYLPHTLFCGYANGHNLYFPTIEAASEGGYGADSQMSPVELGAGEQLMNQALKNLYGMWGKFKPEPSRQGQGRLAGE